MINKYIIIIIILMIFVLTFLYMKNNNISILSAESAIDNSIDVVLKWLHIIWSKGKYAIIIISIIAKKIENMTKLAAMILKYIFFIFPIVGFFTILSSSAVFTKGKK